MSELILVPGAQEHSVVLGFQLVEVNQPVQSGQVGLEWLGRAGCLNFRWTGSERARMGSRFWHWHSNRGGGFIWFNDNDRE